MNYLLFDLHRGVYKNLGSHTTKAAYQKHGLRSGVATRPRRQRKPRKPNLATALKQASKAGVAVASATIEDGKVLLTFGEAATSNDSDDEVEKWLSKHAH